MPMAFQLSPHMSAVPNRAEKHVRYASIAALGTVECAIIAFNEFGIAEPVLGGRDDAVAPVRETDCGALPIARLAEKLGEDT